MNWDLGSGFVTKAGLIYWAALTALSLGKQMIPQLIKVLSPDPSLSLPSRLSFDLCPVTWWFYSIQTSGVLQSSTHLIPTVESNLRKQTLIAVHLSVTP